MKKDFVMFALLGGHQEICLGIQYLAKSETVEYSK